MKAKIPHLILAGLFATAMASQAAVVLFQSDFTIGSNTNLETATTINDFRIAKFDSNSNYQINTLGRLQNELVDGNDRSSVYTQDSWGLDPGYKGFTLDVTFLQTNPGTRFSFGLMDVNSPIGSGPLYQLGGAGTYGIGLATAGEFSSPDALLSNFAGTKIVESTGQGDITYGTLQTFSMTVTADSWSYSLNGSPATTGTFAGGSFDITRSYRFYHQAQRGNPSNRDSYFTNITLSAVPEPSSTALLGLGALVLALRRRRAEF